MNVLVAAAAGALAVWLYRSGRAREEVRRRFSAAPEPVRRATQSVASAAAAQVERAAEAVSVSSLPGPVKETVSQVTATVREAAEQVRGATAGGATAAGAGGAASMYLQELPDGSWVGNAAWGGRTLTDGATDPDLLIRRLAAHLAAMPEAGRPATIKLTRVPRDGQREEREVDLAGLLP
jgi:hypothetical protein